MRVHTSVSSMGLTDFWSEINTLKTVPIPEAYLSTLRLEHTWQAAKLILETHRSGRVLGPRGMSKLHVDHEFHIVMANEFTPEKAHSFMDDDRLFCHLTRVVFRSSKSTAEDDFLHNVLPSLCSRRISLGSPPPSVQKWYIELDNLRNQSCRHSMAWTPVATLSAMESLLLRVHRRVTLRRRRRMFHLISLFVLIPVLAIFAMQRTFSFNSYFAVLDSETATSDISPRITASSDRTLRDVPTRADESGDVLPSRTPEPENVNNNSSHKSTTSDELDVEQIHGLRQRQPNSTDSHTAPNHPSDKKQDRLTQPDLPRIEKPDFDIVWIYKRHLNQAQLLLKRHEHELAIEFVEVPEGEFKMGSVEAVDESPQRTLSVPRFFLAKYETTVAQLTFVLGNAINPKEAPSSDHGEIPASRISWYTARKFCQTLERAAQMHELTIRLPYEYEWEYAVKLGVASLFNRSSVKSKAFVERCWIDEDPVSAEPHRVGQKLKDSLGLYDIIGNVEEWVYDAYHRYGVGQPRGPIEGTLGVVRGGNCLTSAYDTRPSKRRAVKRDIQDPWIGFRIAIAARP